jgi:hypothetical protein
MSSPTGPLLSSATLGCVWGVARVGDGRNKSGLRLHLVFLRRGGQMSSPTRPLLSSATWGCVWRVARVGDGRNKSGLRLHLLLTI